MTDEKALLPLPCPVCRFPHALVPEHNDDGFWVCCGDPDCWASCEGSTPDNAIKRWNTRTSPVWPDESEAVPVMALAIGNSICRVGDFATPSTQVSLKPAQFGENGWLKAAKDAYRALRKHMEGK